MFAAGALPAAAQTAPASTAIYRVRAGDTLWRISRRYATTPQRLAALNGISVDAKLRIGAALRVPVVPVPVRPQAAAPPPAPAMPAAPAPQMTANPNPIAAAPDVVAMMPGLTGQDAPAAPDAPASEPAVQPPATEPPAPAVPVPPRAPSDAARPRVISLPSRGAQWMTTIVALSKRYLGAPYRWGGESPSGFDCSGFLNYIFEQTGIDLPRTTFAMFAAGTPVPNDQLRAGDIVFFQTVSPGPSHAGVYLGDGRFIHASSGQRRVTVTAMAEPYYTARYLGARRY
jgi:cell wall-associated NlpC family hydrolase